VNKKWIGLIFCLAMLCASTAFAKGADNAMVAARQKVFGIENVDAETGNLPRDKVIFSWLSNSTFAASIQGRVIYLDTYVTRLEVQPGRTPLVIKDMVDLKPEAILLGHGHFDHADNAAYIAAKTGAMIYATEETCGVMQKDFERMKGDSAIEHDKTTGFDANATVKCSSVTTAGSIPGTQVLHLPVLEPNACVIAFRHMHSVEVDPDPSFPPTPVKIIVDPRDATLFPAGVGLTPGKSALPGQMDLTTLATPGGPDSLFYDFILRDGSQFTFAWHDTAGALKEGKGMGWNGTPADGERILRILKTLPPTDLQMGTASSGNFNHNGLRDLIMYQQALHPKIYMPNHLTSGTATREASSMSVYAGYMKQLELMGLPKSQWPEIRWLIDPTDYLRPIVFDTADPAWKDPNKERTLAELCGNPVSSGSQH
jgi:hypothetical protein